MISITRTGYNLKNAFEEGTRFVIGNGHIGYRGVMEENDGRYLPCFSMVGFFDQYKGKWREPVAFPNPFHILVSLNGKEIHFNKNRQTLDLEHGVYYRSSSSPYGKIQSERFASRLKARLIAERYTFAADIEGEYSISVGMDTNIKDINGPHFIETSFEEVGSLLHFRGITNEKDVADEYVEIKTKETAYKKDGNHYLYLLNLKKGQKVQFEILVYVYGSPLDEESSIEEAQNVFSLGYKELKKEHSQTFARKFNQARVVLKGNKRLQQGMDYCNYLLVSSESEYLTSIPARGFSGQTYKGAAFWDSEVFLLPYYLLYSHKEARKLIEYRISGLPGALEKAKRFSSSGAFYAWESQENGREACTMYSVTDPKTGRGIRTYFIDKQIHISADVALALKSYLKRYQDDAKDILSNGGLEMLKEICLFYASYAKKEEDGYYHLNDVIGPDEYHERIDDNAFTSYQVRGTLDFFFECLEIDGVKNDEEIDSVIPQIKEFSEHLYIPPVNKEGIIEQFRGYFNLEDCTIEDVRSRLKDKNQYWGGKEGPATSTRIIKQADVVALLALYPDLFPLDIQEKNYDFYKHYTEHGSSLSNSMHSLLAFRIGREEEGYNFMEKSALTDISGHNKEYAGGIYIGGSHMAAAGGAYLSMLYGMLGYDGKEIHPHLTKSIKGIEIFLPVSKHYLRHYIIRGKRVIKKERRKIYD